MDPNTVKNLVDKLYDKRKLAASDVERTIRDALYHSNDPARVGAIVRQLVELASNRDNSNIRNGGIMGLAGAAIALGTQNISTYLVTIAPPILACFHDPDQRVRYFACESMYNVAKVAKGEVLIYFNELFDALSKLAADSDQAVKNGGELLDRLIKDIVVEQASTFVAARPTTPDDSAASENGNDGQKGVLVPDGDASSIARKQQQQQQQQGGYQPPKLTKEMLQAHTTIVSSEPPSERFVPSAAQPAAPSRIKDRQAGKAPGHSRRVHFSLARFIPLLAERIHVINPFTRTYLVSWLNVLDSLPELEFVSYLPHFLDGLLNYLNDPTEDIKIATMHVLADFLKEIREAAEVSQAREEARLARLEKKQERVREREERRRRRAANGAELDSHDVPLSGAPSSSARAIPGASSSSSSGRRQSTESIQHSREGLVESPTRAKDLTRPATADTSLVGISEEGTQDDQTPIAEEREEHTDHDGFVHGVVGGNETMDQMPHDAESEEGGGAAYEEDDLDGEGAGHWVPGQGVAVDHAAIMEILLQNLSSHDSEIQATCLRWIAQFILFVKDTTVPFTPRLIPFVLGSLAHDIPDIKSAAHATNLNLFRSIQELPNPPQPDLATQHPSPQTSASPQSLPVPALHGVQPASAQAQGHGRKESIGNMRSSPAGTPSGKAPDSGSSSSVPFPGAGGSSTGQASSSTRYANTGNNLDAMMSDLHVVASSHKNQQHMQTSPLLHDARSLHANDESAAGERKDPFEYQATVNALVLQFISNAVEPRVAALHWLKMLHQKAPRKILSMHDGTFPALLKILSDDSETVVKADLQLLAQISSASEEDYFPLFMGNLLSLFSTDRKLLETRGSLIIRQLCVTLNSERIYRTFAELLEKDEDLEFASIMVQNLHLIMITSEELADFRKRLKNLETKDGQTLFTNLYRSWSHNAVAAFSLCLLAQAYEHASNLLQIFAELEVSVALLIQFDKLVQLLESPVFTSLRLQLLEPDKNPYLFKCLYGLLMFLPQSSAFLTLRNRLNAVSPLGFLHVASRPMTYGAAGSAPPASAVGTRSTIRRGEEIKWQELLTHFRQVQIKHERSRRSQHSDDSGGLSSSSGTLMAGTGSGGSAPAPARAGGTGQGSGGTPPGASGTARRKDTTSGRAPSGRFGAAAAGGNTSRSTSAGGGTTSRPMSPQHVPGTISQGRAGLNAVSNGPSAAQRRTGAVGLSAGRPRGS